MKNSEFLNSWLQSVVFDNATITNGNFNNNVWLNVSFMDTNLQGTEVFEIREIRDFLKVKEFDASMLMPIESLMNDYNCKNNLICSNN